MKPSTTQSSGYETQVFQTMQLVPTLVVLVLAFVLLVPVLVPACVVVVLTYKALVPTFLAMTTVYDVLIPTCAVAATFVVLDSAFIVAAVIVTVLVQAYSTGTSFTPITCMVEKTSSEVKPNYLARKDVREHFQV